MTTLSGVQVIISSLSQSAGLLAPIGITITPAVAAILMSTSTVIVAINAMK